MADLHFDSNLSQQLDQGLRLSPQLRQSLRLLQAPSQELSTLLQEELAQNPTLEVEEEHISLEEAGYQEELQHDDITQLSTHDWREENIIQGNYRKYDAEAEKRRQYLFDSQQSRVSLQQHLLLQVGAIEESEQVLALVRLLISHLDDRGLLQENIEDLALRLQLPYKPVKQALAYLQRLDPAGVGASSVQESLCIQAARTKHVDVVALHILENYFDLLVRNRRVELARKLKISTERVALAFEWIQQLNPHPTSAWSSGDNREISADVAVFPSLKQGELWQVEVINTGLPKLKLNSWYKDLLATNEQKTRDWVKEKLRDGNFFIRALEQRQETLKKVATEMIRLQPDLPRLGIAGLKPMTMAQVAQGVGLHETTISRAVAGKYMSLPVGMVELRNLFATSLTSAQQQGNFVEETNQEGVSSHKVRQLIAELIEREKGSKPLSDNALSKALEKEGVRVARRTVAKYREQLGILPSNLRRR